MRINEPKLRELITDKLRRAGLLPEHASTVADVLAFAESRGIHVHGAMRVAYYAERRQGRD